MTGLYPFTPAIHQLHAAFGAPAAPTAANLFGQQAFDGVGGQDARASGLFTAAPFALGTTGTHLEPYARTSGKGIPIHGKERKDCE